MKQLRSDHLVNEKRPREVKGIDVTANQKSQTHPRIIDSLTPHPEETADASVQLTNKVTDLSSHSAAYQTGEIPKLYSGILDQLIYFLCETFYRSIWWRHQGKVFGNVPEGRCVLVANHGSYLDFYIHCVIRRGWNREVRPVVKKKVARHWFFSAVMRAVRAIPLEESHNCHSLKMMNRFLSKSDGASDGILGVFPEGTRTRNGNPLPASKGAAWVARHAGVPLLPVALCGFYDVWPPDRLVPIWKRSSLQIRILEPISLENFTDDQLAIDLAMTRIKSALLDSSNDSGGISKL